MTKKNKENLNDYIQIRVTSFEKNMFKMRARIYGYKSLSDFIVTCATNFPREFINKEMQPVFRKKEGSEIAPDFLINDEKSIK